MQWITWELKWKGEREKQEVKEVTGGKSETGKKGIGSNTDTEIAGV